MKKIFQILLIQNIFFSLDAYALIQSANVKTEEKSILKADKIEGDRDANIIKAIGNVEVKNGSIVASSDQMTYYKNEGIIKPSGHIKIKELEIGKLIAKEAEVKDDFSQGFFLDSSIVFLDGSYLKSEKITRENPLITKLRRPLLSICPNDKIVEDNNLAGKLWDTISVKSSNATINREKNTFTATNNFIRFYKIPVLYTPYLSLPLSDNKRKSGFLTPSYVNNSQFGIGFNVPYFIAVAPNIDLIVTPKIYLNSNQFVLNNQLSHLVSYGKYNVNFEVANNEISGSRDRTAINRTKQNYRYYLQSDGKFIFTTNSSLDYKIQSVGDRNYLRDYNFNYAPYTLSKINYDYTNNNNYFGAKALRIQELENQDGTQAAPLIAPIFNNYVETKPVFFKEKYALSSNFTAINRDSGLQYRRLTLTPEMKIPFNFYGNLIDLNTKVQTDFYNLENNFKHGEAHQIYNKNQTNYKPEFSARWRLPLIQKLKNTTTMFEPTISFVSSSMKKNYLKLPDEDSNNSELTINNLFISDRIAGYDRNEIGERVNYGARSSLYNKYGQFELNLGQSYRISNGTQDVAIRGFKDSNKSNIVGQASYKAKKYFDTNYIFQLNESHYTNDVNSWAVNFYFDRFTISNDYLLIRKGVINATKIAQDTISASIKTSARTTIRGSVAKNLVTNKNLTRSLAFEYSGCCVLFSISATENNSSSLIKTQRSYNLNITVKDL